MTGEVLVGLGSRRKVSKGVVLEVMNMFSTLAVMMVSWGTHMSKLIKMCVHFFVYQLRFDVGKGKKSVENDCLCTV